jgi:HEPN domain-containing protein
VEPEFTHNIGILLNELEKYTEIADAIKESIKLTNYAVQARYPGEYDDISKEEYEKAVKIAKSCLDWTETQIKGNESSK